MTLDPRRRLLELGHDITNMPLTRIPTGLKNVCFIVTNCYESYRRNIGTGPANDAVSFAKFMRTLDYHVYILQTPHARSFLLYAGKLISGITGHCVFFYVGQMNQCLVMTRNEKSFVFDDGPVSESAFIHCINENRQETMHLTMITDACPRDSLFDIGADGSVQGEKLPPGTVSIATIPNAMTMRINKPGSIDDQGVFCYHMTKLLKSNPLITYNQLEAGLRNVMRDYGDDLVIGYSSPEILDEQIFDAI